MKVAKLTLLIFPLLIVMPQLAEAQTTRTMSFDASSSLMLQEFQAMLTFEDEAISVAMRLGRTEAKPGVDRLEQGDVILMMNGRRVQDIEGLRELYDGLEKESEIKIGVRRGEQRFILSATKGDIPEGGGRMVMNFGAESDTNGVQPVIVPSMGLLLTNADDGVIIERVISPMLPDELTSLEIEGYKIISFNNEKPESATDLKDKIETIDIGEDVSFTFEKDGDEKSITFKKAAPKGNFTFSNDNN